MEEEPQNKIEAKTKNFIRTKFFNTTIFLAVFTGLFYLLSYYYHFGYLDEFGISTGLFPYGFEIILAHGALFIIFFLGTLALMSIGLFLLDSFLGRIPFFQKFSKEGSKAKLDKPSWARYSFGALMIFLLVVLLVDLSKDVGHWMAQGYKEDVNDKFNSPNPNSNSKRKMVTLTYQNVSKKNIPLTGFIVASSEVYCAIYMKDSTAVIPRERIETIKIFTPEVSPEPR